MGAAAPAASDTLMLRHCDADVDADAGSNLPPDHTNTCTALQTLNVPFFLSADQNKKCLFTLILPCFKKLLKSRNSG